MCAFEFSGGDYKAISMLMCKHSYIDSWPEVVWFPDPSSMGGTRKGSAFLPHFFAPSIQEGSGNQTKPEGSQSIHFCAVMMQGANEYYAYSSGVATPRGSHQ